MGKWGKDGRARKRGRERRDDGAVLDVKKRSANSGGYPNFDVVRLNSGGGRRGSDGVSRGTVAGPRT